MLDDLNRIEMSLREKGYLMVGAYRPSLSSQEIAEFLGGAEENEGFPQIQRLQTQNKNKMPPNTYSGIFGLEEFPLHTDFSHWYIPPRYLVLRSVQPGVGVYTKCIDFSVLRNELSLEKIKRALFRTRKKATRRVTYLKFYNENDEGEYYRWDSVFLVPSNVEARAVSAIIERIDKNRLYRKIYLSEVGDTLILDNWKMLHGRSCVAHQDANRIIERFFLWRHP